MDRTHATSETIEPEATSAPPRKRAPEPTLRAADLPDVCTVDHVAKFLGVSIWRIYKMERFDGLKAFRLASIGDNRRRYSGHRLRAWAHGDLSGTHINGHIDRPRAFGASRKLSAAK